MAGAMVATRAISIGSATRFLLLCQPRPLDPVQSADG